MGIYADHMNALKLSFNSPDGLITAQLNGNMNVSLTFKSGAYRQYNEESLAHQIMALARLVNAGRRRAHIEALSVSMMETAGRRAEVGKDWAMSAKERRFRDELAEMQSRGRSKSDVVKIANTGLLNWEVRIKSGTVDKFSEEDFKREFASAVGAMMSDYRLKVANLKHRIYGEPTSVKNLPA